MSDFKPVEPANIPVVDFKLLSEGSPEARKASLNQLDDAFQTYGFIYLSNHSIGEHMIDEALLWVSIALIPRFDRLLNALCSPGVFSAFQPR